MLKIFLIAMLFAPPAFASGWCRFFKLDSWVDDDPYFGVDSILDAHAHGLTTEAQVVQSLRDGYAAVGIKAVWRKPYSRTELGYYGSKLRDLRPAYPEIEETLLMYEKFERPAEDRETKIENRK